MSRVGEPLLRRYSFTGMVVGQPTMPSLFAMVPSQWVGNLAFKDDDGDMLMLLADNDVKAMLEEEDGERRRWRW